MTILNSPFPSLLPLLRTFPPPRLSRMFALSRVWVYSRSWHASFNVTVGKAIETTSESSTHCVCHRTTEISLKNGGAREKSWLPRSISFWRAETVCRLFFLFIGHAAEEIGETEAAKFEALFSVSKWNARCRELNSGHNDSKINFLRLRNQFAIAHNGYDAFQWSLI